MVKHCISLKNKENSFIFLRKLEHNIDNTILHINKDVIITFSQIFKS